MGNDERPLIVAFVSGKGGVGKTMLAVAFAKEISLRVNTLMVDLDFFNRGLTGLMRFGRRVGPVDRPKFLASGGEGDSDWHLTAEHLYHISYPDLQPDEMEKFETLSLETLEDSLREFILGAAAACSCRCVVLDCHGGPDNSSFAACLLADHALLISEPDRITFYGTLNFIRQLARRGEGGRVDLRLVFNKVVPAFSGFYLRRLYNSTMRQEFGGQPLLAAYPLEVYLTKEFEKTPFLTTVYPDSLLARKTRTLLYELLISTHADMLARGIKHVPKCVRTYRKLTLGKRSFLLNFDFIMATIVAGLFCFVGLTLLHDRVLAPRTEDPVAAIQRLELLAVVGPENPQEPKLRQYLKGERKADESFGFMDFDTAKAINKALRGLPGLHGYPEEPTGKGGDFVGRVHLLRERALWLQSPALRLADAELQADYAHNLDILRNISLPVLAIDTAFIWLNYAGPALLGSAMVWFALALLILWSRVLDTGFTYNRSRGKYGKASIYFFVAVLLWLGPAFLAGAVIGSIPRGQNNFVIAFGLCLAPLLIPLVEELWTLYRNSVYERQVFDPVMRVAFLAVIGIMSTVAYRYPLVK